MITTLSSLLAYFQTYKDEIAGLEHVEIVFSWEEILALQLEWAKYPLLVIEIFEVPIGDIGGSKTGFDIAYTILKKTQKDEKQAVKWTVMNDTLELARLVVEKLFCDGEDGDEGFDVDIDTKLEPITSITLDNCYGWRGYAKIKIYE